MIAARRLLVAGFALAFGLSQVQAQESASQPAAAPLPLNELRTFAEVFERIRGSYVEPVDDATLLENAIRGMLEGLDPHSAYLTPEDYTGLQDSTEGQFGGLGIEVGQEDGFLKVVSPIDDTPAAEAGIEAGDLIIKIDDQPVKGMSLMDAVDSMRGEPGSEVRLTLVRGEGRPFEVTLTRAIIKVKSVKTEELEPGYAYLRVTQFQINTGDEVRAAINRLNANGQLKGLVLDLRNNPGGVLQAAVEVVDSFVDSGLIVYTKGRLSNAEMRFNATSANPSGSVPLVVLINGGSASASEIVAGALQDLGRGVIMGTDSFGKGSVQTVLPLNNDRALKLTTALYYTPSGRSIQAQGIVPDIRVERGHLTVDEGEVGFREADLAGHINNASGNERPTGSEPKPERSLLDDDYQLTQALSLLKGLNIATRARSAD
ncbi:S41 family peptidase [Halopseudomonas aestusnigri]|uniref:Carboxyl-terminal processing protease n=1 Tax=Halopseudomonas aestusnigri TaxID=857252 RepID=A0AAQ1G955_9GAMM|nr:S41 family peptidase [Halopseudomonas aestusnigri]OWL86695.1 peptidase S41 [Halopseudomonas aestusnigri]SEG49247.1 carboxyl-terminal processing protease [Halopseudomonas aestusnigri]